MPKDKKIINRAGILPFHVFQGGAKALFMMPANNWGENGDKYQIAKGKIEEGESIEDAALRETFEELGLKKENIVWMERVCTQEDIMFYIAEVKDPYDFEQPHFETDHTAWLSESQFVLKGRKKQFPVVEFCFEKFLEMKSEND